MQMIPCLLIVVIWYLPVIIIFTVDIAIFSKARQFWIEGELAIGTLEAVDVPRFLHGEKVVAVDDLPAAAVAGGYLRLPATVDHGHSLKRERKVDLHFEEHTISTLSFDTLNGEIFSSIKLPHKLYN